MAENYIDYLTPDQLAGIGALGVGGLGTLDILGGSAPAATQPYRTFTAPLSNKGNPTSKLAGNQIVVYENQPVRLVDNRTGTVAYEGTGYEAAQKAIEMGQILSDTYGRKATWNIQTLDPYADTYVNVANEKKNKSFLGKVGSVLGTALPIAMIPLTMGASAPLAGLSTAGTIGLGAGVGAASAALRGQNILKGAALGGLTSAGGQFLSGPLKGIGLSADVARAVGTGLGATAGGLATGQNLKNSLLGGVAAGGLTYLGGKLFQPGATPGAEPQFDINGDLIPNALSDLSFGPITSVDPTAALLSGVGGGSLVPSGGAAPSYSDNIVVTAKGATPVASPTGLYDDNIVVTAKGLTPVITDRGPVSILPPTFGGTPIVTDQISPSDQSDRQDMTDYQMEEVFGLGPGGTGGLSTKDLIRLGLLAPSVISGIGSLLGGGGGGGTGIATDKTPVTYNPLGRGLSQIAFDPFTYGQATGNQPGEFAFFTPTAAAAKKDGGEIEDDTVKHLIEYHKGGGHSGPGPVKGVGSGQEDLIPAWLSDGEYVWSAQDVADLGDGSTDEGVRRLDKMRQMVRKRAGRKDIKKIAKPQRGIDKMLKAVGGTV